MNAPAGVNTAPALGGHPRNNSPRVVVDRDDLQRVYAAPA